MLHGVEGVGPHDGYFPEYSPDAVDQEPTQPVEPPMIGDAIQLDEVVVKGTTALGRAPRIIANIRQP